VLLCVCFLLHLCCKAFAAQRVSTSRELFSSRPYPRCCAGIFFQVALLRISRTHLHSRTCLVTFLPRLLTSTDFSLITWIRAGALKIALSHEFTAGKTNHSVSKTVMSMADCLKFFSMLRGGMQGNLSFLPYDKNGAEKDVPPNTGYDTCRKRLFARHMVTPSKAVGREAVKAWQ